MLSNNYICSNCGYICKALEGNPLNGIPSGTAFEDLPDDWNCPMCFVGKALFDPLERMQLYSGGCAHTYPIALSNEITERPVVLIELVDDRK